MTKVIRCPARTRPDPEVLVVLESNAAQFALTPEQAKHVLLGLADYFGLTFEPIECEFCQRMLEVGAVCECSPPQKGCPYPSHDLSW